MRLSLQLLKYFFMCTFVPQPMSIDALPIQDASEFRWTFSFHFRNRSTTRRKGKGERTMREEARRWNDKKPQILEKKWNHLLFGKTINRDCVR